MVTRKIDGKKYKFVDVIYSEKRAKNLAEEYREKGYYARTIYQPSEEWGTQRYTVWIRKK